MTITAAMRAKAEQQKEEDRLDVDDLWSVSNIYHCNYWFLGVEEATEVTESFQEAAFCNDGENFSAQIKVPQSLKRASTAFAHVTFAVYRWQMFVEAASCLFKVFERHPALIASHLFHLAGVPGDSGIWSGPSDGPAAAGRVLFQWTGQKLVVSPPAERRRDAGGEC